jgi:predicted HAD superfamily phosphohydrolase
MRNKKRRKIIKINSKRDVRSNRKKIITIRFNSNQPRYSLNEDFEFFYELRDLILKSSPTEIGELIKKINRIGHVKLAIISGIFMNKENTDPLIVDLFMVGDDVEPRKLKNLLKSLEAEIGKEIKFSLMDKEEFKYRFAMFDRFIRVLLEGPHEKLINKLGI